MVENKYTSQLQFEVQVSNTDNNVMLPNTMIQETVFGKDNKVIAHFMKIDPEKEFSGRWTLTVQNNWKAPATSAVNANCGTPPRG